MNDAGRIVPRRVLKMDILAGNNAHIAYFEKFLKLCKEMHLLKIYFNYIILLVMPTKQCHLIFSTTSVCRLMNEK